MPPLKGEVGGKAARRGQFRYKIKIKKIAVSKPLSQCYALPAPLSGEPKIHSISFGGHGTPCPYRNEHKSHRILQHHFHLILLHPIVHLDKIGDDLRACHELSVPLH